MFCEADIFVWKFLTRPFFNWVFFQLQRFVCISLLNYAKLIGNCRRAFRCLFRSAYIVGKKLIRISISFWCWIFTSTSSPARGRVCELQEISEFYQPFRSKETCHIHVAATLVNLCSIKAPGVCFCEVIDGEWFEFDVKGWSMSFHHEL